MTTIASGDSTISETGSTLWIDDISLVYNTSNIDENNTELTSINASSGELRFFNSNGLSDQNYTVTNIAGQLIQQGECKENVLFTQPSGLYLITITDGLNQFTKKVYVH